MPNGTIRASPEHVPVATAVAKEEAEQADKKRCAAETALKKEEEAKQGLATQDSTLNQKTQLTLAARV